jgi:hypothetical protein
MPTHASDRPGLGQAAKAVAEHASTIARLELELATTEIKRKLAPMALGIGMLVGAAIFALFGLALALAAGAAALTLVVPVWGAILIVMGGVFGVVGVLALLGLGAVRKASPPVPQQAIQEAKLTTEALRGSNGR